MVSSTYYYFFYCHLWWLENKKEQKFKVAKQQELVALQKRIQTGREEQKKQRHLDLERLLQRYQNVKAELEAQQNLERVRMEKLVQSGALTATRKKKGLKTED